MGMLTARRNRIEVVAVTVALTAATRSRSAGRHCSTPERAVIDTATRKRLAPYRCRENGKSGGSKVPPAVDGKGEQLYAAHPAADSLSDQRHDHDPRIRRHEERAGDPRLSAC
jgi:hypothetical protein